MAIIKNTTTNIGKDGGGGAGVPSSIVGGNVG
jgi:hypothetical protein